jgi:hypothetical protein
MSVHRIVPIFAVALALGVEDAQAFFDLPWITPAVPRAGQGVSINVHGGTCDVFVDAPTYPRITIQDTAIHVVRYGWHETFQDFCIFEDWTITDLIGPLSQGDYTVTVDFLYDDPLFGPTTINLGVVPFTVAGMTPSTSVPMLGAWGQLALLILVPCLAARALRTRQ